MFAALAPSYEREVPPGAIWNYPTANDVEPDADTIERLARIAPVTVRTYRWTERYTTDTYLRLLDTYSDHRSLAPGVRARLYSEMADVINRQYGGHLTMCYLTILYLAIR